MRNIWMKKQLNYIVHAYNFNASESAYKVWFAGLFKIGVDNLGLH